MTGKEKTILAVDKDDAKHERETAQWMEYGVNTLRVDTMSEAINTLIHRDDFLFIAINEDTIPDFAAQLGIMRDVTILSIFVLTSNYSIEKKIKAMDCGADVYDHFNAYIKNDVICVLAYLKAQKRKLKRLPKRMSVLTGGNMILSPLRRNVFIKDVKVPLNKKEFDVLQCLMTGNGSVVTHAQILRKVWGDKSKLKSKVVLWKTIDRLRRKLYEISPSDEYIELERDVGYKFRHSNRYI